MRGVGGWMLGAIVWVAGGSWTLDAYAQGGDGTPICCNSRPAHVAQLTQTIEILCGLTPTVDRKELDRIVADFQKQVEIVPPKRQCRFGPRDPVLRFEDQKEMVLEPGCANVHSVWEAGRTALQRVRKLCPMPSATPPNKDGSRGCCSGPSLAVISDSRSWTIYQDSDFPRSDLLQIFLVPEPQVVSNYYAGISALQVPRPGVPQLVGASLPLVVDGAGVSGGAGVSVSPFRIAQMAQMQDEAALVGRSRRAAVARAADLLLDASSPEPPTAGANLAPSEDARRIWVELVDAVTPAQGAELPAVEDLAKLLKHCTPDAAAALAEQAKTRADGNARLRAAIAHLDNIGDNPASTDCNQLLANHGAKGFSFSYGEYTDAFARSVTFSLTGAAPKPGLSRALAPDRLVNLALTVDWFDGRDPLRHERHTNCLRDTLRKLQSEAPEQAATTLEAGCSRDHPSGAIGSGLETSVRYDAEDALEVGWDSLGFWGAGELNGENASATAYSHISMSRCGDGLCDSPGLVGGLRGTIGNEIGSLALDTLAGLYVSEARSRVGGASAEEGIEGGLQGSIALPLGLSISAGGTVRCLFGVVCEGRFIGGVGWLHQPDLATPLALAAGRRLAN